MPTTPDGMSKRLESLKADIIGQGRRVQALVESAIEAVFSHDTAAASRVVALDEAVDGVDVKIEQAAVSILSDACTAGSAMTPAQVRVALTIVKVNNELERIADIGVLIAESISVFANVSTGGSSALPQTFRVLANSVIGIIRDVTASLDRADPRLAKVVLMSEAAVGEFRKALVREIQTHVSRGQMPLQLAAALHDVAMYCLWMADHCTNIAEQVIYAATGTIVRHMEGKWEEVKLPGT